MHFKVYMNCKIRMTVIIIALLCSGLYIGFEAGKALKDVQLSNEKIALSKEVKHQDYFIRWKLGELRRWETTIKKDSKTVSRKP